MGNRIIRLFFIVHLISFGACAQGLSKIQSDESKSTPRYFGPHSSIHVNEEKRRLWILGVSEKVSDQEYKTQFQEISPVITDIPDFKQVSYRIHEAGKIRFLSGEEIIIQMNSAHTDPEIGDVVVAVGNDGLVYVNTGHVCGGMIHFIRQSALTPLNKKEFFEQFYSDTDDEKWKISDISMFLKKK